MTQHIIYAATDATVVELESSAASTWIPETVTKAGKQYKRLTPDYWAWFYRKYCLMEKVLVAGKVSEATFSVILDRISALYNHAVAIFGKETLDRACEAAEATGQAQATPAQVTPDGSENVNAARSDRSHVPSLVAERGVRPAPKTASMQSAPPRNHAVEKIDAIRDRATALGWTHDQLYRTDGIAYRDWGLIRFLDPDDEIGEITLQRIEIKNSKTGKSLYFYNHRVDQPWMRKSCKAGVEDGL